MLAHRLYRSDKTGDVITERFTHLTYPWHWHYTVLRALDYLQLPHAIHDERLDDPIRLLLGQRRPNGRWPLQKRIPGTLLVEMEKPGGESRWNTLRALRVLRRRDAGGWPERVGQLDRRAPSAVAVSPRLPPRHGPWGGAGFQKGRPR